MLWKLVGLFLVVRLRGKASAFNREMTAWSRFRKVKYLTFSCD